MSTHYYLGCDKCKKQIHIWRRAVAYSEPSQVAVNFPDVVQNFIFDHNKHIICFFDEHDPRHDDYEVVMQVDAEL